MAGRQRYTAVIGSCSVFIACKIGIKSSTADAVFGVTRLCILVISFHSLSTSAATLSQSTAASVELDAVRSSVMLLFTLSHLAGTGGSTSACSSSHTSCIEQKKSFPGHLLPRATTANLWRSIHQMTLPVHLGMICETVRERKLGACKSHRFGRWHKHTSRTRRPLCISWRHGCSCRHEKSVVVNDCSSLCGNIFYPVAQGSVDQPWVGTTTVSKCQQTSDKVCLQNRLQKSTKATTLNALVRLRVMSFSTLIVDSE